MDGGTIESLLPFLRFGLLGLAAIIFILAIIGYLAGNIDETRARLLRTFLFIGALFGGLAFLTEMFRPEPVNSDTSCRFRFCRTISRPIRICRHRLSLWAARSSSGRCRTRF